MRAVTPDLFGAYTTNFPIMESYSGGTVDRVTVHAYGVLVEAEPSLGESRNCAWTMSIPVTKIGDRMLDL